MGTKYDGYDWDLGVKGLCDILYKKMPGGGAFWTSATTESDDTVLKNEEALYTFQVALPGLSMDKLELSFKKEEENSAMLILVVKAEDNAFVSPERRQWVIPEDVNLEGIKASMKDGILTVSLPKKEKVILGNQIQIVSE